MTNEIQRYSHFPYDGGLEVHDEGDWVKYDDLLAEVTRLQNHIQQAYTNGYNDCYYGQGNEEPYQHE